MAHQGNGLLRGIGLECMPSGVHFTASDIINPMLTEGWRMTHSQEVRSSVGSDSLRAESDLVGSGLEYRWWIKSALREGMVTKD